MTEWMLCEWCHYSWLRDPTRSVPERCPQCKWPELTVVSFGQETT